MTVNERKVIEERIEKIKERIWQIDVMYDTYTNEAREVLTELRRELYGLYAKLNEAK